MITIDVRHNFSAVQRAMDAIGKQARFATAGALTRTAQTAKREIERDMARVFDRPTAYTLNALRIRSATASRLEAMVWVKDDAGKGTPATKYLTPQIFGGSRGVKRFERALTRIGILPDGMKTVPGEAAPIDAYGNMQRGEIVRILAYFQAFGQQGYSANMPQARRDKLARGTRKRYGFEYFVVRQGARNLRPGIWKRVQTGFGKSIKPIVIFVREPAYRKRLPFFETAQRVIDRDFGKEFDTAMASAMRTARA
jgi:hypothetical protein